MNRRLLARFVISIITLFCVTSNLYAQEGCGLVQFKELEVISHKDSVTHKDIIETVKLVKQLEQDKCAEYAVKKNGRLTTRTSLFGEICLKRNDQDAVQAYVSYIKRNSGSADEQVALSFEKIFQKQPMYVLAEIGYDEQLLNKLEWGFVNNHAEDPHLTTKNYMEVFFKVNPQMRSIYPGHRKQIDYLLHMIYLELRR